MSVSLLTVWRAARARVVPFTGESAGYLAFLACEELALAPRSVSLSSIGLEEDGGVRLRGREPSDDGRAERELRALLAQLLEVASSPGLALSRAATRAPSGSLATFSAELSKALIPFNRAAARRALGRLHRETRRALETGELAAEPAVAAPIAVPAQEPAMSTAVASLAPTPVVAAVVVLDMPPPTAETAALPQVAERETSVEPPPDAGRLLPEVMTPMATIEVPAPPPVIVASPPVFPESTLSNSESQTRPETLAARRRRELTPVPEWTEPLPTRLRRVAAMAPVPMEEPVGAPGSSAEPASRDTVSRETPFLGSLAVEIRDVVASHEPLAFEPPLDDATERVPTAFEPERPKVLDDSPAWPIELADGGAAIPLEAERDALPDAPVPEPYPGMIAEKSDVRKLLSGFQVAHCLPENDLRAELKRLAGIDETPKPTDAARPDTSAHTRVPNWRRP